MFKLIVFVPESHLEAVKIALFEVGAGRLGNYDHCAWQTKGIGQFRPLPRSHPTLGKIHHDETVEEWRVEMLCPNELKMAATHALKKAHPYEEPAFEWISLVD